MTKSELTDIAVFGILIVRQADSAFWLTPAKSEGHLELADFAIHLKSSEAPDIETKAVAITDRYVDMLRLARENLAAARNNFDFQDYVDEIYPFAIDQGVLAFGADPFDSLRVVNVLVETNGSDTWVVDFAYSFDFETGLRDNILVVKMNQSGQLISISSES